MKTLSVVIIGFFITTLQIGCGSNVLSQFESEDKLEDAAVELDNGNPAKAISLIESYLQDNPNDPAGLSLMSAAVAQKYGIDTISFALKMAESSSSDASSGGSASTTNAITKLFPVVPEATADNIAGIGSAVDYIEQIPSASRTNSDQFKLTMLLAAQMAIQTKQFDTDGDGTISAVESFQMASGGATAILSTLSSAGDALSVLSSLGGGSSDGGEQNISSIEAAIAASDGATDEEKLANFLANN